MFKKDKSVFLHIEYKKNVNNLSIYVKYSTLSIMIIMIAW